MTMQTETRERHSTWQLAALADCGEPDRSDYIGMLPPAVAPETEPSAGARFLRSVEDAVFELWDELEDKPDPDDLYSVNDDGSVHEIADAAPDVYTHTRWAEFHDLAAYNEEPGGLAGEDADMTQLAGIALYMIAERLAWALLEELAETAAGEKGDRCEECGANMGDELDLVNDRHAGSCSLNVWNAVGRS